MDLKHLLVIYILYLLVFSFISFIMYGIDKSRARNNKERIKEKNLLQITVLGGAFGTLLGRTLFRHKTNKIYFSIINIASILCEALVIIVLCINI